MARNAVSRSSRAGDGNSANGLPRNGVPGVDATDGGLGVQLGRERSSAGAPVEPAVLWYT